MQRRARSRGTIFAPNAFIRIDRDGKVTFIDAAGRDGAGHLHVAADADRRGAGGRAGQVTLEHAPPDDKLYCEPAAGRAGDRRLDLHPRRSASRCAGPAPPRARMLVAAAAQRWSVDPASCRAERGEVVHAASGRKLGYGALVRRAAADCRCPTEVALKDPKDFKLIGTPAKRLDTPTRSMAARCSASTSRLPGMKVATVAACPVFGGKLAQRRRQQGEDGQAACARSCGSTMRWRWSRTTCGRPRRGSPRSPSPGTPGRTRTSPAADIVRQLGAGVAEARRGRPTATATPHAAIAGAASKLEAVYELPFLAHAADGADELHRPRAQGRLRRLAGDAGPGRAQAAVAEANRPAAGARSGVHNQLLGGGFGRRLDVDGITQAAQIAKQVDGPVKVIWTREEDIQHDVYRPYYYDRLAAGLDAHGRPLAWTHRVAGSSIMARWAPPAFKNGLDPDAVEGAADARTHSRTCSSTTSGRAAGHDRRLVARRRPDAQRLRGRELRRRAGRGRRNRTRWLIAGRCSTTHRARGRCSTWRPSKAGWGRPLPPVKAAASRFTSPSAAISRRSPRSTVASDGDGQGATAWSAPSIAAGRSIPTRCRPQIEGGIVFGMTAALYGEITIKDGRVEQANFDNYRSLRINEAPVIEVHLVASTRGAGRHRRTRHRGDRARRRQRDLRGDRQAPAKAPGGPGRPEVRLSAADVARFCLAGSATWMIRAPRMVPFGRGGQGDRKRDLSAISALM